ncbi:MAG: recombinase family protein [Proteobacteria bacterium]|nr:MAG: recombinase family protein [Pseudomonadota bacterium]
MGAVFLREFAYPKEYSAKRQGWKVVEEFIDRGVSGAKGRAYRLQFDRLCKAATRREFDLIMSWLGDRAW